MFQITTIAPFERGILFRQQRPIRWLEPGRHVLWGAVEVLRLDLSAGHIAHVPELAEIIPEHAAELVEVGLHHRGLLSIDGLPRAVLVPGRYLVWQIRVNASIVSQDTRDPRVEIPDEFLSLVDSSERMSVTIAAQTRGLFSQRGMLVRLLEPGIHHLWNVGGGATVETTNLTVEAHRPELAALLSSEQATVLDVGPEQLAIYWIDGQPRGTLASGRYLLWQLRYPVTAQLFETTPRHIEVPRALWPLLSASSEVRQQTIQPHQRGLLYVDGELVEELEQGRYALNVRAREVSVSVVEMREQQLLITGQEVMSADKVSLRVSILLSYQIVAARQSVEQTTDLSAALYSAVQLAARRTVAGMTIDQLLEQRTEARTTMLTELTEQATGWGVTVRGLDLKDLTLPGEMKTIFNQVIEAKKRAAANVVTRREETAATRSLANTAKMLEENPTLMRLKELETMKELAEHIGELTVMATPDQLMRGLSFQK